MASFVNQFTRDQLCGLSPPHHRQFSTRDIMADVVSFLISSYFSDYWFPLRYMQFWCKATF